MSMTRSKSKTEKDGQAVLTRHLSSGLIPQDELLDHVGLFIKRQLWGRLVFMLEIYRKILPVHGTVMEFGVRWGQNLATFSSFRGMFEPFNYNRKIVGFDTFQGFPGTHEKDGDFEEIGAGNYAVPRGYEKTLEEIMEAHQQQSPIPHVSKHEIVAGDVTRTLDEYLERHPETIVALAYFDLDLYEPTKHCLERIIPLMPKGAVIGFDELNDARFPGETCALKEVVGLNNLRLQRLPFSPLTSFAVLE